MEGTGKLPMEVWHLINAGSKAFRSEAFYGEGKNP